MEGALVSFIAKGTPSGWTLCVIGMAGLVILLRILATQRPKMKQLEIDENAAIRSELRAEMKALREEVHALRGENKGLREEIKQLHGVIDGMRRAALESGISAQRVVADALPKSPQIERALTSLGNIQGDARQ